MNIFYNSTLVHWRERIKEILIFNSYNIQIHNENEKMRRVNNESEDFK